MRSVTEIPHLIDIPVLVRSALNVPVQNGKVVNTFRLRKALPTIAFLQKERARVILMGHIGEKGTETLLPVYEAMKEFIPSIRFCEVNTGEQARKAVRELPAGGVLMLENLRRDIGETKNSKEFAQKFTELADVFVQDSFDVCHRSHASVVTLPTLLPSYAGFQLLEEVRELTKALAPASPSLAILSGAKFSTKEPVIKKLIEIYDHVFVGGALANDFMVEKGYSVGSSLVSPDADKSEIQELLKNKKLLLPLDEVVARLDEDSGEGTTVNLDNVPDDKAILDDGVQTTQMLAQFVKVAKTILWNGPLGNYEKGFVRGTHALAAEIACSGAYSILGGGDTVAAVEGLGISDKFSFISTGGGAMLDFLAKGTLPGLTVLDK
jgi:phosphoglycerate kinase